MAWIGIWFEHEAHEERERSPERFSSLVPPIVYPYAHSFVEAEEQRLTESCDPNTIRRDGERFNVYYSLNHDGGQTGLDQQGCCILRWLLENFTPDSDALSARFSEIPVVIHCADPAKAAVLGNTLTLLRFLGARDDQAIAKVMLHAWNPFCGSPQIASADYERRTLEFLHGEVFYPEDVSVFDVLARRDLKLHRQLAPCCESQVGFLRSLLEWIDECWPSTHEERTQLETELRNSLADEALYWKTERRRVARESSPLQATFEG